MWTLFYRDLWGPIWPNLAEPGRFGGMGAGRFRMASPEGEGACRAGDRCGGYGRGDRHGRAVIV